MNLDRIRLQRVWEVKTGIEMALSRSPLALSLFQSLTTDPLEAQALRSETNAKRQEAKVLERYRVPG